MIQTFRQPSPHNGSLTLRDKVFGKEGINHPSVIISNTASSTSKSMLLMMSKLFNSLVLQLVNDEKKASCDHPIKRSSFSSGALKFFFAFALFMLVALATLSFNESKLLVNSESSLSVFVSASVPKSPRIEVSLFSTTEVSNENSTDIDWPTVCAPYYNATTNEEVMEWYEYVINTVLSLLFIGGAGVMSGLTLGLLSIDPMQLDILKQTGTEKEKKYAARLAPILKRHHLLLVTLLLWNALCMECLPLFLNKLVKYEWIAIILGVTFVLLFGEIIPQAFISRYGLAIGGTFYWLVWIFIAVAFIIAYPISKLLDWILGASHGTLFKRTELKELVNIHAKNNDPNYHLTEHETKILGGALEYSRIPVSQIMTKFENVYMLDIDNKLNAENMTSIWQAGHSRIPVFKGDKNNIVGILYVKDLILLNPEECLPISTILTFYGREVLKVYPDTYCDEMLKIFKSGRTHIAIVHEPRESETGGDPYYAIVGIVSLEDIIEEIIKDEIVDETDIYVDNTNQSKIVRSQNSLLLKSERNIRLTPKQVLAVGSYLSKSLTSFRLLPEEYLHKLLGKCSVVEIKKTSQDELLLMEKGKECDYLALVLTGKLEVVFSDEKFFTEMGPWSYVGDRALTNNCFIPDYDVRVPKEVSFVKVTKKDFIESISQIFAQDQSYFLPKDMEWMNPIINNMNTQNLKVVPPSPHMPRIRSASKTPEHVPRTVSTDNTEIELNEVDHTISEKKGLFNKYSKFKDELHDE